jgi:hypothetical protein
VKSRAQHNAYLDEQWSPGGRLQPKGQALLQRRIQHLCSIMGFKTREVPASNLIFTRSRGVGTHPNFDADLPLCMPVHKIFIEAIQPHFLMTFGAIHYFTEAAQVTRIEHRSAEHGNLQAHRGEGNIAGFAVAFGNVPHMSRWASNKHPGVLRWAIEGLRNHP